MTVLQKKTDNPIAHLTADGHRGARPSSRRDPGRHRRRARSLRRGVHPQGHRRAAQAGARQPRRAAVLAVPAGLARRHRRPVGGQDPGEHGDRPQRHARPVGLDARPQDPLHHLGVGQRLPVGAVEALAQRAAPHLHQRHRPRQRPRLRHHARRRGPALAPALPRAAAVELHQRLLLRVRHRGLRPRARQEPALGEAAHEPGVQGPHQAGAEEDPRPGHQGLRRAPAAVRPVVPAHARRQRDRQPGPQPVDPLGHHVRPLPRGRRDLRAPLDRGRDPRRVVPAADARLGQHQRRQGHAHHDRQPVLPDRAPPLPRPARATATRRSRRRCRHSSRTTASPTPPARCPSRSPRRGPRSSGSRCPTATSRRRSARCVVVSAARSRSSSAWPVVPRPAPDVDEPELAAS